MTRFQQGIAFLVAIAVPIYWFWFTDISFSTALSSTIGFAGGWYSSRLLVLKSPELFSNVFAVGGMQLCMLGTVNGVLSLILIHLL